MKTVFILAAFVAFSLAEPIPYHPTLEHVITKKVDAEFIVKQKKILSLFETPKQIDFSAEYYTVGKDYDVEAHIADYTDKKAVEEFLYLWKQGFTPKTFVFSIFNEKQRSEAIALFNLFFYAKDFDTFYKTAAFAKVHLNEGLFLYTYYIAVIHHHDTTEFNLPAPYEVYPELFFNKDVFVKMQWTKMQNFMIKDDQAFDFGIIKENNHFIFYSNYSNYLSYENNEHKLSYFTEDVGLNAYYYDVNSQYPFWLPNKQSKYEAFSERFGELKYFKYQTLLARYYMERLTNGLGEIPHFSWYEPIKTGYCPALETPFYPFMMKMRNNYYDVHNENNYGAIKFLDTFENTFLEYIQTGYFKLNDKEIDMYNSKSFDFITRYWLTDSKQTKEHFKNFAYSYPIVARHVLGAAPKPHHKYNYVPTVFDFYQTSLRDPVFYQLYNRMFQHIFAAMKLWTPYTEQALKFSGVKINDVKVDQLTTFFETFEMDANNAVYQSQEEMKSYNKVFKVRQPRLNHKPFTVTVDVKSDAETDAVVKIFLGPKYNSNGYPISIEDNWMNFIQLDWYKVKLTTGVNKIERHSNDFYYFNEGDDLPMSEMHKLYDQGKIVVKKPFNISYFPQSMMLPKGTKGGYPFQLFVFVYPGEQVSNKETVFDSKKVVYPFDRPASEAYYKVPNMYFKNVEIYHEGEMFPYFYSNPYYVAHHNVVPKH